MNLTARQSRYLIEAPDVDGPLYKATDRAQVQRRRVTSNNFSLLGSGRPQPRQGFLSPEVMRAMYMKSEVVRACIDTLIKIVCTAEWAIKPVDEEQSNWLKKRKPEQYANQQKRIQWAVQFFKKPNSYERLKTFKKRILLDLLVLDWGVYEVVDVDMGGYRLPLELGAIAGETMEVETDSAGIPVKFYQSRNVLQRVEYEPEELGILMQYPSTWQPYGMSVLETAFVSVAADLNANQHNNDFFGADGIPPGLLAVLGVSEAEFRRITAKINQTKRDNPHNIHAFRGSRDAEGKPQELFQYIPLNQSNRDMQWKELITMTINRICMLFGTTPSQIGFTDQVTGGIGSGVAETQENLQQNKGVAPLLDVLSETFTETVLQRVCGWNDLEYSYDQAHTPQKEADYQKDSQELQLGAQTINEFRSKWGGRDGVEWGDDPLNAPQAYQQKQQMQSQMMMGGGGMPPGLPGGDGQPDMQKPQDQPDPGAFGKGAGRSLIIRF